MKKGRIVGVGSYLPSNKLTNQNFKHLETSDEWITERTGIKQRFVVSVGETTSDMAANALNKALDNAKLVPSDLDGIIVATTTPDQVFPATAVLVQKKIEMTNGFAFDVSAVCSGFIYAMHLANALIASGSAKRVAVVGAESMSKIVDWLDRSTAILFGDGAGAWILEASDDAGIVSSSIYSDGQFAEILQVPGGVCNNSFDEKLQMNGREVFRHAIEKMSDAVLEELKKNGMDLSDVDWVLPHQANIRIISAIAKKIGVEEAKIMVTVDQHANTSAASIPLAFNEYIKNDKVKRGDKIALTSLGAGLTWASAFMVY